MNAPDEILESAKPPRPSRPTAAQGIERRRTLLMHGVALAALAALIATAVFTGIIAWETHQDRIITRTVYCSNLSYNPEPDEAEELLSDQLGCEELPKPPRRPSGASATH